MVLRRCFVAILAGAACALAGPRTAPAGPLDPPPGPISSTAKPLSDVEPRTAISQATTPGDSTAVFVISQPGSYYLTGNVTGVAGRFGVLVNASNVTIDLAGFNLRGVAGSLDAVFVNGTGVRVHSGTITDWGGGINRGGFGSRVHVHDVAFRATASTPGAATVNGFAGLLMERCRIDLSARGVSASGAVIRDCVVGISDPAGYGFALQGECVLERCVVIGGADAFVATSGGRHTLVDCTASLCARGFILGEQSMLERCSVNGGSGDAITVGRASTVSGCTVISTGGGTARGIVTTSSGCVIRDCAVYSVANAAFAVGDGTVLERCSARASGVGFVAGANCRLRDCTAALNLGAGFAVGAAGTLEGCVASFNGSHGFSTGDACSLVGCTAADNLQRGISVNNGCSVLNCLTRNNQADGIYVNFSCTVIGNNGNGDGVAAGNHGAVRVVGQANRIEGNNATFADRGVMVEASGNVIVRNSARGCTVNFDIVGGNDVGPIGSAAASTSPWANIQF